MESCVAWRRVESRLASLPGRTGFIESRIAASNVLAAESLIRLDGSCAGHQYTKQCPKRTSQRSVVAVRSIAGHLTTAEAARAAVPRPNHLRALCVTGVVT